MKLKSPLLVLFCLSVLFFLIFIVHLSYESFNESKSVYSSLLNLKTSIETTKITINDLSRELDIIKYNLSNPKCNNEILNETYDIYMLSYELWKLMDSKDWNLIKSLNNKLIKHGCDINLNLDHLYILKVFRKEIDETGIIVKNNLDAANNKLETTSKYFRSNIITELANMHKLNIKIDTHKIMILNSLISFDNEARDKCVKSRDNLWDKAKDVIAKFKK